MTELAWTVEFADEFEREFDELSRPVQDELLARARLLERFGPELGRPRVVVAGDKSGVKERPFYRRLIADADRRFDAHLEHIEKRRK